MKALLATGIFGAIAIVVLTEIMSIAVTASAMQHAASYNSWMAL